MTGDIMPIHATRRTTLGLIGVGAFGAFCIPHLRPHFAITAHDPHRDPTGLDGVRVGDLAAAAGCDIVVLAVPTAAIGDVARTIAPHLRPGALVLDVGSIKSQPLALLDAMLPPDIDLVGTHPLFGPQSGRDGIRGLRLTLCPVRGRRSAGVARFLRRRLGLEVIVTTPEAHDREMAYVQGLTHLVARIVGAMALPPLAQTTVSFEHLRHVVDTVRHDSDALFRAIAVDNPFAAEVATAFFDQANALRRTLTPGA